MKILILFSEIDSWLYTANPYSLLFWPIANAIHHNGLICFRLSTIFLFFFPPGFQVLAAFEKIPFERAFRRPYADFTTNTITTQYWNAVSHRAPAIIYDFYLRLTGRKPRWEAGSTALRVSLHGTLGPQVLSPPFGWGPKLTTESNIYMYMDN